ncbi:5-formyltetrahydrofolate cyclo-ligase [Sungkyunkwania multivorans]|uniref:5-formyltetrahydrofolate cyclo-ligase n=1 Tax=Sungkyunkwania multivorans TaxID=1173618 RepID=A0ABW3D3T6_9FLAO
MNKEELRGKYKMLRKELSDLQLEEYSIEIANNLLSLPIWDKTYFHIFLPIVRQKEVNTEYILNILAGKDKEIIVSRSDFSDHSMRHYLLTDSTKIRTNDFGIPEPVDGLEVPVRNIEVVFVPLLAFDKQGHRVGYGKGFYDRFLTNCNTAVIKVGLSIFGPELLIDNVQLTDIKLNFCVTPTKIYHF